jgi:hypothetical protein
MAAIGAAARASADRFRKSLAGGSTGWRCATGFYPDWAMLAQPFARALGRSVTD